MSILNVPTITPTEALDQLRVAYFLNDPMMLHGPAGQGKTSVVSQLAKEVGAKLVVVTLSQKQPGDFVIPYISPTKEEITMYLTKLIPTDPNTPPTIVFFDELPSALPEVQIIAHEPFCSRELAGVPIPDTVYFVAAGNTAEDNCHTYEMGDALIKRLTHVRVECNTQSWLQDYAVPNQIAEEVILFLKSYPQYLNGSVVTGEADAPQQKGKIGPCPRVWKVVSDYLHLYNIKNECGLTETAPSNLSFNADNLRTGFSKENFDRQAKGRLGNAVGNAFLTFMKETENLPPMEDLFKANGRELKDMLSNLKDPAPLYGLCYSAVAYCSSLDHLRKACHIFTELASIRDGSGLPRKEVQSMAQELLFKKSKKLGFYAQYLMCEEMKEYRPQLQKLKEMSLA